MNLWLYRKLCILTCIFFVMLIPVAVLSSLDTYRKYGWEYEIKTTINGIESVSKYSMNMNLFTIGLLFWMMVISLIGYLALVELDKKELGL